MKSGGLFLSLDSRHKELPNANIAYDSDDDDDQAAFIVYSE